MIPNNNLSVLPWYSSIEQQNARKWWIYDRVYPLFTPAGYILPFQIMRPHLDEYTPTGDALTGEYFRGAILPDGSEDEPGGTGVHDYDPINAQYIYFEDLPKPPALHVSMAAFDSNRNLLDTYTPDFPDGVDIVSGGWTLPTGTTKLVVQTYDANLDVNASIYAATYVPVAPVTDFKIYTKDGDLVATVDPLNMGFSVVPFVDLGYDVIVFGGKWPIVNSMNNGQYYCEISDWANTWYSEIFTVVNDISPYLKIEWWDVENFVMDAGTIVYEGDFVNVLYLPSDIAKPEYHFDEEGEQRDGYFFPIKQISEKKYRFNFLASEYLLDVMRFIRMADFAQITKNGQRYSLDTFLITPEWEDNGDVAVVEAEFDTATVAKKIGLAYIKGQRGDFNDDFNNDFNN